MRRPFPRNWLLPILGAAAVWALPAGAEPLQPWQMVRSLQLVQDRIADGDGAALPMQRRLLEMIDARLRTATPAELADPRNWDAVMAYAAAGGNPATIRALMPDLLAAADAGTAEAQAAGHAEKEGDDRHAEASAHGSPPAEAGGNAAAEHGRPEAQAPAAGHAEDAVKPEATAHAGASGHGPAADAAETHGNDGAEHGGEPAGHAEPAREGAEGGGEPEAHEGAPHAEAAQATDGIVTHGTEAAPHATAKEHGTDTSGHGEGGESAAAAPESQKRKLALGLFNYGRGREPYAAQALAAVDPLSQKPELGAFVALIKGSLEAKGDPAAALKLFDQARLVAPGTLVEEAALRRSVGLAVQTKDRARFLLASGQYVRRFLRSPYASQFADAFVAGVVALQEGLDLEAVSGITADMAPEQERVAYLRIARQAGIDHLAGLAAFASAKAEAEPEEIARSGDPRTILYAALSEVTGEKTGDTLARLDALDAGRLTASDRELLEAVKAVAAGTLRPPAAPAPDIASGRGDPPPAGIPVGALPSDAAGDPGAQGDLPPGGTGEAVAPAETTQPALPGDPVGARVTETRKRLDVIDRLLVEAGK